MKGWAAELARVPLAVGHESVVRRFELVKVLVEARLLRWNAEMVLIRILLLLKWRTEGVLGALSRYVLKRKAVFVCSVHF